MSNNKKVYCSTRICKDPIAKNNYNKKNII